MGASKKYYEEPTYRCTKYVAREARRVPKALIQDPVLLDKDTLASGTLP
jgi:hypothetical protein